MKRYVKSFGLSLVAIFAISAVSASGAAATERYHSASGSGNTDLTGIYLTENIFTVDDGNVKCAIALFSGSYTGTTSTDIKLVPTYTNCKAFGQTATVHLNSCYYTLTEPTGSGDNWSAGVHIACSTAGDKIQVTVGDPTLVCTITIGPQTPKSNAVDLTDYTTAEANRDDIVAKSTVTGVTYTGDKSVCTTGTRNNGAYIGEVTIRGYSNLPHIEANQVDLWVA
jgi:hypothetical protein